MAEQTKTPRKRVKPQSLPPLDLNPKQLAQTIQALQESEARYRALFDGSPDPIFLADLKQGTILDLNPAACRLLGQTRERLVGQNYLKLHPPAAAATVQSYFKNYISNSRLGKKTQPSELLVQRADGTTVPVEISAHLLMVNGREILQEIFRDISERKQVARVIRENEERYRRFRQLSVEGTWRYDLIKPVPITLKPSEQAKLLVKQAVLGECNDAFARQYGYQQGQEMLGLPLTRQLAGTPAAIKKVLAQFIQSGYRMTDLEYAGQDRLGENHWFASNLVGIIEQGNLVCIWGTQRDITEAKRVAAALRESEQKYRLLVENQTDLVVKVDSERRFLFASPTYCKTFNKKEQELLGQKFLPQIHQADQHTISQANLALRQPPYTAYVEHRALTKDGWRWFGWANTAIRNNQGELVATVGVGRDITEHKQSEEALRSSEARFQQVFDQSPIGAVLTSLDGKFIRVNQAFCQFTGYSEAELTKLTFPEITHPEHRTADLEQISQMIAGKLTQYVTDKRYLRKDGRIVWGHLSVGLVRYPTGHPIYGIALIEDITRFKEAEDQLRQSEDRYHTLFNSTNDAIMILDLQGNLLEFNRVAAERLGYSRDELLALNLTQINAPEFAALVPQRIKELQQQHQAVFESAHLHRDGRLIPVEVSSSMIEFRGQPAILSIVRDITERKQAESEHQQRLQRAEKLNRLSQALADVGLDYQATLETIARHLSEMIGDACTLNLISPDGQFLNMVAVHHPDRATSEFIGELMTAHPSPIGVGLIGRVAETGAPLVFGDELPQATLRAQMRPELLPYCDRPGLHSMLAVPMRVQGRIIGVAGLTRDHPGNSYSSEDHALLQELADRAALMIDRARLYEANLCQAEQLRQLNLELEERIQQRTDELTAINNELESFAYSVSHDLRAPLRGIDGFIQILTEEYAARLDATGQDYCRRIKAGTHRMAQLIDDLLQLSRVSRAELKIENVNLSELAAKIANDLVQAHPQRQVQLVIKPKIMVRGDPRLLQILLNNLLDNAWKFTAHSKPARIELGTSKREGPTVVFVRDNGAGFDMAYAAKLFVPFQRLHNVEEYPGTGIGLATAQRIINRHAGQIWAESVVGQGTTFYFSLGKV